MRILTPLAKIAQNRAMRIFFQIIHQAKKAEVDIKAEINAVINTLRK